jgi:hypothetical protein
MGENAQAYGVNAMSLMASIASRRGTPADSSHMADGKSKSVHFSESPESQQKEPLPREQKRREKGLTSRLVWAPKDVNEDEDENETQAPRRERRRRGRRRKDTSPEDFEVTVKELEQLRPSPKPVQAAASMDGAETEQEMTADELMRECFSLCGSLQQAIQAEVLQVSGRGEHSQGEFSSVSTIGVMLNGLEIDNLVITRCPAMPDKS